MNSYTRVYVVDDHPVLRKGIIQIIADHPEFEIAGQAGSAEEALRNIDPDRVDVAVLDISLPEMSGLELAERLLDNGARELLNSIEALNV